MTPPFERKEVILEAQGVGLVYDRPILRDINFRIHNLTRPGLSQGQVTSLIGRSGIGKTQLFKIISGLNRPTTGQVRIGEDLHQVKPGDVGIVSRKYVLLPHRTVMKNMLIAIEKSGAKMSRAEAKALIEGYANEFGLIDHLKKWPAQLSGGQRQRVSILQQLMTGNKVILMDEPFSGLDVIVLDKVLDLLLKVSTLDEMNTIIIVSHDIENSLAISDSVFILANQPELDEGGRPILADGKPRMIPGATLVDQIDLADQGLAFQPDIKAMPKFREMLGYVKSRL